MWTCPKCNAQFVTKNFWLSCGNYCVEGFLEGKSERGKELFWRFVREYQKNGPITLHPVKGRVAFMVKVRFSGVNKVGNNFIEGAFWLKERIDSDKFFKIEKQTDNDFIHRFRLYDESFIDDEFVRYMKMATPSANESTSRRDKRRAGSSEADLQLIKPRARRVSITAGRIQRFVGWRLRRQSQGRTKRKDQNHDVDMVSTSAKSNLMVSFRP